jgi:hypothetical protein
VPVEQERELCQHLDLVFKHGGIPVAFGLHGEGQGVSLEIFADRDQDAILAVGDVI